MEFLIDLFNYLAWCVVEGDWMNDYLTHFPDGENVRDILIEIGMAVAHIFGHIQ